MSDFAVWEERYARQDRKRRVPDEPVLLYGRMLLENCREHACAVAEQEGAAWLRVLDVASGEGRNLLYLARLARDMRCAILPVGAERSPLAVERSRRWLEEEGLSACAFELDLEELRLPHSAYGAIVVTRYLQRSLFPVLFEALLPGGLILYETYTVDYLRYGQRNPQHLLKPGELRDIFMASPQRWEIISYREEDRPQTREYVAVMLARRLE